jgi:hypothetical protein
MHGIAEPNDLNQANAALVLQSVMLLTMVRDGGDFFDTSGESTYNATEAVAGAAEKDAVV